MIHPANLRFRGQAGHQMQELQQRLHEAQQELPEAIIARQQPVTTYEQPRSFILRGWEKVQNLARDIGHHGPSLITSTASRCWKWITDTIRSVANNSLVDRAMQTLKVMGESPLGVFVAHWVARPLATVTMSVFGKLESGLLRVQESILNRAFDMIGVQATNALIRNYGLAIGLVRNFMPWVENLVVNRYREILAACHNLQITAHGQAIDFFLNIHALVPTYENIKEAMKPMMFLKKEYASELSELIRLNRFNRDNNSLQFSQVLRTIGPSQLSDANGRIKQIELRDNPFEGEPDIYCATHGQRFEASGLRLEASAQRLEASGLRLEASAQRLEASRHRAAAVPYLLEASNNAAAAEAARFSNHLYTQRLTLERLDRQADNALRHAFVETVLNQDNYAGRHTETLELARIYMNNLTRAYPNNPEYRETLRRLNELPPTPQPNNDM